MKRRDFYYDLDESLVAQTPIEKRDASRLLVYDRAANAIFHKVFSDVADYLHPGDVLVINETKVIPARLYGRRVKSGKMCEFLLLKRLALSSWDVIMKPRKKAENRRYSRFFRKPFGKN